MNNLEEEYRNLAEDINIGSVADGVPKVENFFKTFAELAAENGDCPDLEYFPILSGNGYRIDGYAFDILDDTEGASGDLYIAVCSYFQDDSLPSINAKDIDKSVTQVERFLKFVLSGKTLDELEDSSYDYRLAMLIRSNISKIARIRVLVFTNAHLKIRKKIFDTSKIGNLTVHTNVFDLERYSKISTTGTDPVEIDLLEDFKGGIPCIQASGNSAGYKSYLFAIPGPILADIFAAYGNRLLEQNVRTYLQNKTATNKGILKTISDEPSMFFAYNNGLTATASMVNTIVKSDGSNVITYIKDFQIVNGGQTTASILYARDGLKCDLAEVFAQVKLSVVEEKKLSEIVPKISEYANTQNKVSLADLASNSPAQIRIERLSKEVVVPQKAGALHASKWFYERARGQYKSMLAYKTQSQRNKIESEFPKSQLIEKTDLAKFEFAFDGRPHHVSEGAQKCFGRYIATSLKSSADNAELTDTWFKCAVAKGILFRRLDKEVALSDWYKNDKGLKAQTVAYAVSACAHAFREMGQQIDLLRIWREQDVPTVLLDWMVEQAHVVHGILNKPPGIVKNPTEFCKKEFCWTLHVKGKISNPSLKVLDYGVAISEFSEEQMRGKRDARRDNELDFEIALAKLVPRAAEIRTLAESKLLLSENNTRALTKLETGRLTFTKSEKNSLKTLLDRLEIDF
ncbi:MAG: AIPR family protein [Rhodoferax sp.]